MSLKRKVFVRIAFLISLLVASICVAASVFIIKEHRTDIKEHFRAQTLVLAEGVKRLILWNDPVALRRQLEWVVRNHSVVEYAFIEKKSKPYIYTFPEGVPKALLGRVPVSAYAPSVWTFQNSDRAVYYDVAARVGNMNTALHLGLGRDEIDQQNRSLISTIIILGGPPVMLGLLMAAFFSNWTTREVGLLTEALRRSEEKYRNIFEQANDAIFIFDASTFRCLDFNEYAAQQLGYSREELLQLSPKDISSKGDLFGEEILRQIRAGNITMFESIHKRKDGMEIPVETSSRIIEYEGRPAIQSIVRNISERKQAEISLRNSEAKFRSLVEQAADAFFVHDLEGRIVDVNRRACDSLGYTREELLALSVPDISLQFRSEKLLNIWNRMVPGEPVTIESVQRHKDGTTFPVEIRIGRLNHSGGRELVLALARDITERKQAEEVLLTAHDEMVRQVKVRTAELTAANERLKHEIEERRRTEERLLNYQGRLRSLSSELLLTEERERRGIATDPVHGLPTAGVTARYGEPIRRPHWEPPA